MKRKILSMRRPSSLEKNESEVDIAIVSNEDVDNGDKQVQATSAVKQESSISKGNDAALCPGAKQEFIEIELKFVDEQKSDQVKSTLASAGSVHVDQDVCIKDEPEETYLNVKPTKHTVRYYRNNQSYTGANKREPMIDYDGKNTVRIRRVKEESVEDICGDAEPDIYICDYCHKMFTNKTNIGIQITCVHTSGSYKCYQCGRSFKCERHLRVHKADMHTTLNKECNVCGKFFRPRYLKRHILNMHSDKKLQCNICGENIMSKNSLHQHMNYFHGQQSIASSFFNKCGYCQKIYTSRHNLNSHIRKLHGEGFHICFECNVSFQSEDRLQDHIKLVHSKEAHEEYNQQSTRSKFGGERGEKPHPLGGEMNAAASASTQRQDVVVKKEEPADEDLELGPVVFQHMDYNYRPYKEEPLPD